MSDSVRPHRWQPTRLPRPWDSPGKNTGVGCHFLLHCMQVKSESEVAQSCPTLSDLMDCSLPGSSVHGIFQAIVLEWVAIAFSCQLPSFHKIHWHFLEGSYLNQYKKISWIVKNSYWAHVCSYLNWKIFHAAFWEVCNRIIFFAIFQVSHLWP